MLFRRASDEGEARLLAVIGMCVLSCVALIATWVVVDPLGGRPADVMNLTFETPYVGEGVQPGTALLLHGVAVGEITEVASMRNGGVRMLADVQRGPTTGLTDTMKIDFRPANYFGVTGISMSPGEGGRALARGSLITVEPIGNFTLQTLLARLGEISHGVLTPRLIDVVDRTTTYIDGLDPLLETMLVVANSLATVQNVSTAQLLANTTGISVAFPGFVDAAIHTGNLYLRGGLDAASEDYWANTYSKTIDLAATDLFGAAGTLLSSHSEDLAPLTNMIKLLTDIAPGVIPSDEIAYSATEMRTRLERLFSGPPDRRAVNVRVILDSLPGVAAPLAAVGAAPGPVGPAPAPTQGSAEQPVGGGR